jgi:hypothetical protein
MKNFNKFSFHQFLESRDESFYREAKFEVDIENEALKKSIKWTISRINTVTGEEGDKYNPEPSKSLNDLHFVVDGVHIGHEDDHPTNQEVQIQSTQMNVVEPLESLVNDPKFNDWSSDLEDSKKEAYLKKIKDVCARITSARDYNHRSVGQRYDQINNLNNKKYRQALHDKVLAPLYQIKYVLGKAIAPAPAPVAPVAAVAPPKPKGFFSSLFGGSKK